MPTRQTRSLLPLACVTLAASSLRAQSLVLPPAPAGVETFTVHGLQFARVQASGVPAFPFQPEALPIGRPFGGGDWNFGIARTELTQELAIELPNAFYNIPVPTDQPWSFSVGLVVSGLGAIGPGVVGSPLGPQGRRLWTALPEGANRPISGATGFFHAAAYCNWLHNDKQSTVDALLSGAYDLRGWDDLAADTWVSVTRSPGARFFLPTYDEWAVATFFDPHRDGTGAWWRSMYRRDRLPVSGAPGTGETSVGWVPDGDPFAASLLAVAAYGDQQSAWGLFDTSGTSEEYLDTLDPVSLTERISGGVQGGRVFFPGVELADWAGSYASGTSAGGFRVGTTIPSSWTVMTLAGGTLVLVRRARRSRG